MPTSDAATFGNDLNGNRKVDAAEQVTYTLGAAPRPCSCATARAWSGT